MCAADGPSGLLRTVDSLLYTASADLSKFGLALLRDGAVDPSGAERVLLEINANLRRARELLAVVGCDRS